LAAKSLFPKVTKPEGGSKENKIIYQDIFKIETLHPYYRTHMSLFPAKVNRGITLERKKVVKCEIRLGLQSMVLDLTYEFQVIYLKGTYVTE